MKKMKACVYSGKGDLRIQQVDKPSDPNGGAIAEVLYSSICGTDIRTYKYGNPGISTPHIIGHEGVFEIIEISDEFNGEFAKGDKVIITPAIGCGHCPSCLQGRTNVCLERKTLGFEFEGTFSEYFVIPRQAFSMHNVLKLIDPTMEKVASTAEPIACAINGQSFLDIKPSDNVLIFGAGFLGCIHAELALSNSAEKLIMAEVSSTRRKQVKQALPMVSVLDPSNINLAETISELTNGAGVDVVITACPAGITHLQALEVINPSGRISLFGGLAGSGTGFLDSNLIHYKELSVFGAHASTPKQNLDALHLLEDRKIDVEKYLTYFSFDDVEAAFQALLKATATKAVLMF